RICTNRTNPHESSEIILGFLFHFLSQSHAIKARSKTAPSISKPPQTITSPQKVFRPIESSVRFRAEGDSYSSLFREDSSSFVSIRDPLFLDFNLLQRSSIKFYPRLLRDVLERIDFRRCEEQYAVLGAER